MRTKVTWLNELPGYMRPGPDRGRDHSQPKEIGAQPPRESSVRSAMFIAWSHRGNPAPSGAARGSVRLHQPGMPLLAELEDKLTYVTINMALLTELAGVFHTPHEMPTGRSAGFSLQAASRLLLQAKACAPPRVCEISGLEVRPRALKSSN